MRIWPGLLLALGWLVAISVQTIAGAPAPAVSATPAESLAVQRFLAQTERPPVANQARRRLEASSTSLGESAWMNAITKYEPGSEFRYWITEWGGSERIARRVLKAVLEAEKQNSARGEWRKGNLSRANYVFDFGGRAGRGMLKMHLIPRREDTRLIDGAALLTARSGNLVRVEGRLSKSPSWWIRWVDVTRSYAPIAGSMMPVAVESTADVRIAGLSKFAMTYEYELVGGVVIDTSRRTK